MPAPGTQRTNDQWLSALRGDDPDEAAVVDLRKLVGATIAKVTASRGPLDASTLDDLIQVGVLQILQNLERFEGRSKFTTWAYSVAVRAAFTELRRSVYRSSNQAQSEAVLEEVAADENQEPSAAVEGQEVVDILYRVIEQELTDRQRTAVLGELRGRPQAEVLEELGINRNALYKLLHDARRKLRGGLAAVGICDAGVRGAFDLSPKDSS